MKSESEFSKSKEGDNSNQKVNKREGGSKWYKKYLGIGETEQERVQKIIASKEWKSMTPAQRRERMKNDKSFHRNFRAGELGRQLGEVKEWLEKNIDTPGAVYSGHTRKEYTTYSDMANNCEEHLLDDYERFTFRPRSEYERFTLRPSDKASKELRQSSEAQYEKSIILLEKLQSEIQSHRKFIEDLKSSEAFSQLSIPERYEQLTRYSELYLERLKEIFKDENGREWQEIEDTNSEYGINIGENRNIVENWRKSGKGIEQFGDKKIPQEELMYLKQNYGFDIPENHIEHESKIESQSEKTESQSEKTESQSEKTGSQSEKTGSQSEKTGSQFEETGSQFSSKIGETIEKTGFCKRLAEKVWSNRWQDNSMETYRPEVEEILDLHRDMTLRVLNVLDEYHKVTLKEIDFPELDEQQIADKVGNYVDQYNAQVDRFEPCFAKLADILENAQDAKLPNAARFVEKARIKADIPKAYSNILELYIDNYEGESHLDTQITKYLTKLQSSVDALEEYLPTLQFDILLDRRKEAMQKIRGYFEPRGQEPLGDTLNLIRETKGLITNAKKVLKNPEEILEKLEGTIENLEGIAKYLNKNETLEVDVQKT